MEKWPGWSAPLLGVIGGGLGGLALAGDPANHFPVWQTSLAGAVAGLAVGLIVCGFDRRHPSLNRLREMASERFAYTRTPGLDPEDGPFSHPFGSRVV